ncbi:MAG: FAD-dependent oxidoreductase, partial [Pseudomonadota bacterium]
MQGRVLLENLDDWPGLAVVTVDNPPVNAMSPGIPRQILEKIAQAEGEDTIHALLIKAGGEGGLSGADIRFQGADWPEAEPKLVDLIEGLESTSCPVAILMQKHTFGGGLEIAMACGWRIATPSALLGQPEIKLGIPPGAGGTQRLPRLIGAKAALDMILTGEPIVAERAKELGVVDYVTGSDTPIADALSFLESQNSLGKRPRKASERNIFDADSKHFAAARLRLNRQLRGQPAAAACIDAVEAATELPLDQGLKFERSRFLECVASPEAAAMRHLFFAERSARAYPGVTKETARRPVREVAVIGAGTMGAGIALALLGSGRKVTLIERDIEALDLGTAKISARLDAMAVRGKIVPLQSRDRKARLTGSTDLTDVVSADLIIEAVFEDLEIKRKVFRRLEGLAKPGALLASNTSYLDIDRIADAAPSRASDIFGLHFFSPADVMPLLEIVRASATSIKTLASAIDFSKQIGKTAVVAGLCEGFIGNRMYASYIREAEHLLEEGGRPEQIDRALTEFGMAMGPFAVRDLAGLDIGWARRKAIAHRRDPSKRYSRIGDLICERGWFGQKTGRGFYRYDHGSRRSIPDPEVNEIILREAEASGIERRDLSDREITDRCLLSIVNEGAKL